MYHRLLFVEQSALSNEASLSRMLTPYGDFAHERVTWECWGFAARKAAPPFLNFRTCWLYLKPMAAKEN